MKISRVIIGLEVHIELKTKSKMFCGCPSNHFAQPPNTQTCPVCLGLPGALPVPNRKAIDQTLAMGYFVGGHLANQSHFDRKNYFYPDLPKGYQISQYTEPLVVGGSVILSDSSVVRLTRIHLEEDTAKLQHQTLAGEKATLIDFNRSGVPLMEIVSEPDVTSSDDAKDYLGKLQQLVRYLRISDADMEKGSMRCEPNVNLEIDQDGKLVYTPIVELKNINSFRFVKKAIDYEIDRQFAAFTKTGITRTKGNKETRGWDDQHQMTVSQRQKEEADDYRYFPEPDIPPMVWSDKELLSLIEPYTTIEKPAAKQARFIKEYALSAYQASILTADRGVADNFEKVVQQALPKSISATEVANVLINKRAGPSATAKQIIDHIVSTKQTTTISTNDIDTIIDSLLANNPEVVAGYNTGKLQALGKIIGLIKQNHGIVVSLDQIAQRIK